MQRYIKSDFDVTLPDEVIFNPDADENTLRRFVQRRSEEDKEERAKAAKREEQKAEIEKLESKYTREAIAEAAEAEDPIQALFDLAVPVRGRCDSEAGEIIRAMMRILYRDYNDGDVFYEGYGRETCLPAVAYLIDVEPYAGIFEEFNYIAQDELHDEEYTRAIRNISDMICEYLTTDGVELFWTPNTRDYFDTPTEEYDEWQPEYDYEGDFPEELVAALERGVVSEDEVESELRWTLEGERITYDDLSIGEYGFTIYGLNRDGLDWFEDVGYSIGENISENLVPEDFDMYDEDYDEDDVWSATQVTAAPVTTQHLEVTKAWNDLFWHDTNFREWALRRDEDYSEGYDFIDDETKVHCEADVTDIRYNPKYDFLLLDITFTTGRFEDGEYIEETAGIETYKFPITRKVEKLLGE